MLTQGLEYYSTVSRGTNPDTKAEQVEENSQTPSFLKNQTICEAPCSCLNAVTMLITAPWLNVSSQYRNKISQFMPTSESKLDLVFGKVEGNASCAINFCVKLLGIAVLSIINVVIVTMYSSSYWLGF